MRKIRFIATMSVLIVFMTGGLHAQKTDNRILLNIAGEEVTAGDFMYVYKKNNINREDQGLDSISKYLQLYINFRLKVREAEELGLDTAKAFITELEGYRKQLAQPYFYDSTISEKLIREAYERKQWDLRASHILFTCDKNALPQDTLKAFHSAMAARNRVMAGEDFSKVSVELSQDPNARDSEASQYRPARKGNLGDLGYFTVFDMVYPFESAAYNTPVGTVSMPVRSDHGYHVIKVTDRKPALGQVQVAHIFVSLAAGSTTQDSIQKKIKIDAAYEKIMAGESFEDIVKEFSEDKGSAANGGKLPWFGSNRLVPDFVDAARNLKDSGDISKPFSTIYGYHIIKLLGRKPVGTFEEEEFGLKTRIEKDMRNKLSEEAVISRIKQENNFKEYPKAVEAVYATLDSSVMKWEWTAAKAAGLKKPVFSIGKLKYSQQDLATYLASKQTKSVTSIRGFFNDTYKSFVKEKCMAYEDSRLEQKYPDFRLLIREYHDGILLFDLMERNVWSKAVKDTAGLAAYYGANKDKYMWDERFHATVVTVLNPGDVNIEELRDFITEGKPLEEILERYNSDTTLNILAETEKYSRGDSPIIDKVQWKTGLSPMIDSPSGPAFVYGIAVAPPEPKLLQEARGLVTADYQSFLEEKWIGELRSKYPVTINQEVLSTLK